MVVLKCQNNWFKSGFGQSNNCQKAYKLDSVVMSRGQTCVHARVNTRPTSAGDYPNRDYDLLYIIVKRSHQNTEQSTTLIE